MDPTSIWADLWKLGPVFAIMGAIIWYQTKRVMTLENDKDKLQQDKLDLTKAFGDVTNVANRHIEASNEFMKEVPQVIAAAIVASQEKVIAEMRDLIRGLK